MGMVEVDNVGRGEEGDFRIVLRLNGDNKTRSVSQPS